MTMTIVDWIDLFTRVSHKQLLINSLKFCKEKKGLNIFGWCLMPSHLHIIANTNEPYQLDNVVRDFKKFTLKALVAQIATKLESHRE